MQMTGEQRVAAPRQRVWEALNDPEVLQRCIPGCQSLERDGPDRFAAVAEVKIGPIGARFKGAVQLSEIDAPNGYTITGSGNGGIAGNAKGGARVRLADSPDGGTLVSYDVDAEVGGRMAQLGGPIIDATARNLAGKFFATFGEVVGQPADAQAASRPADGAVPPRRVGDGAAAHAGAHPASHAAGAASAGAVSQPHASPSAAPLSPAPWAWVVALVVALFTGFMLGRSYGGLVSLFVAVLLIVTAAASYEAGRRGGPR